MVRPHIEFIQSQVLPWRDGLPGGGRDGVAAKVLSRDPDDGAASLLVRYPAGFRQDGPHHLDVDEEIFVLDGALQVDERTLGRYAYTRLPRGSARNRLAAPEGAVALTFLSGPAVARSGAGAAAAPPAMVALTEIGLRSDFDLERTPWDGTGGMGLTNLYVDPDTLERTWVIGDLPLNRILRAETHPVVEEMYLLAGTLVGNLGTMHAGAYFWRPPGVKHGPYGSRTGCLILFRSRGGPLSTTFHDDGAFTWAPAHRPVLPPELAAAGSRPWTPPPPY